MIIETINALTTLRHSITFYPVNSDNNNLIRIRMFNEVSMRKDETEIDSDLMGNDDNLLNSVLKQMYQRLNGIKL